MLVTSVGMLLIAPTPGTSSSALPMIYMCSSSMRSLTAGLLWHFRLPQGCGIFCFFSAGQTLCRARFSALETIAELMMEDTTPVEDNDLYPSPWQAQEVPLQNGAIRHCENHKIDDLKQNPNITIEMHQQRRQEKKKTNPANPTSCNVPQLICIW